jgi:hypothetical protein
MSESHMQTQIKKLHEYEELLKTAAEESRKQRWLVPEEAFLEARRVLIAATEKVEREAARQELQKDLGFHT